MLDKKHKLLEIKTSILVDSLFVWNYKTKHKWRGIEFVDFKEYDWSDDVKNIDFLKSAKEWKTMVKLFEEERELSIYFIFQLSDSFNTQSLDSLKIDIFYELFYLIWLSAIKQWDKLWLFLYNPYMHSLFIAKKWKQNFINIIQGIEEFLFKNKKKNTRNFFSKIFGKNENRSEEKNGLKKFNELKIKNSLVFFVTDELDIDTRQLRILSTKNDLVVCNIFDSFENNLQWSWVLWFEKQQHWLYIDLDNKKKVSEYKKIRKQKIQSFKKKVIKSNAKYILLDETKNVYKEVFKIFRKK